MNMVRGAHLGVLVAIVFTYGGSFPEVHSLEEQTKNFINNNNGFGTYSFEFETSDGTYRHEDGGMVSDPADDVRLVVRGEYGYTDPTGRRHVVRYVADSNGFQPLTLTDDDTSEDVELRRIFPSEFPQDTIRKSGSPDPEHLGRYGELKNYFKNPKAMLNAHFEELACYEQGERKVCTIDLDRYSPEENNYFNSAMHERHDDRRRVFCVLLMCFTEDELDRVVASF